MRLQEQKLQTFLFSTFPTTNNFRRLSSVIVTLNILKFFYHDLF
jgi:hypothetical protein